MRIKLLTSIATSTRGWAPGEVVDWPNDNEARRFIERGYAEAVEPPAAAVETTTLEAPPKKRGRPPKPRGDA